MADGGMGLGKVVIGVVTVAVLGFGLYSYHANAVQGARVAGEAAGRATVQQAARDQPRVTHHSDTLITGVFSLAAREIKRIPVVVGDSMTSVKLTGRFSASGGARDDVEVFVFATRDDFTNWQSGNAHRAIYQSGRTTVANIDVPLKAGTYDLVFSNKHAVILLRNIDANVRLEYDTREK